MMILNLPNWMFGACRATTLEGFQDNDQSKYYQQITEIPKHSSITQSFFITIIIIIIK